MMNVTTNKHAVTYCCITFPQSVLSEAAWWHQPSVNGWLCQWPTNESYFICYFLF